MKPKNAKRLKKMLQPLRFRLSSTTPHETDGRTPFDSDFARVALSASVRRLKDKTQVFPLADYDFVRNRLTHSLEVMTIARGLGLGVEKMLKRNNWLDLVCLDINNPLRNAISKTLEVAALVHDIGNPPFGHRGEKAVQDFFKKKDGFVSQYVYSDQLGELERLDLQNIEGNVQGFRILRHLALAKDEFSFNLTKPVLASIIKYPFNSKEGNKDDKHNPFKKKFGFLDSEAKDYKNICETLSLIPGKRYPLTYLLEAADDITYNACDLEDGFKEGVISIKNIKDCLTPKVVNDEDIMKCLNQLNDKEDQLTQELAMQDLRIKIQSKMIIACTEEFVKNIDKFVEGTYNKPLLSGTPYKKLSKALSSLDKYNFKSNQVIEKEDDGIYKMQYLLEGLASAMILLNENTDKLAPEYQLYMKISPNYRKAACEEGKEIPSTLYNKLLLVTDYIFGMTDGFVHTVYDDEKFRELIMRVKCKIDNQ